MLAPKKLYFGPNMIHVHIDDVITSENGNIFKDQFDDKANVFRHEFGSQPCYSISREKIISRSDMFPDLWYLIVMDFARLEWTNKLDFLPGLSGIARMFLDVYADNYVSGLWANDIHCGLLFSTQGVGEEPLGNSVNIHPRVVAESAPPGAGLSTMTTSTDSLCH